MFKFNKICTLLICFILCGNGLAQTPKCGVIDDLKKITQKTKNARQSLENIPDNTTVYTIPVIFVVYHQGEAEGVGYNMPKATIDATLDRLNNWFGAKGSQSNGFDTKIQFAYAQKSPSCQPINGIVRVDASGVPNFVNNTSVYENQALADTLRYLTPEYNINSTENGIVIRVVKSVAPWAGYASYFGDTFINFNYLNYDNLTPHEVGHILGLHHTFTGSDQNSCPQNIDPNVDGDTIADTDPHKENDNGCNRDLDTNSCTKKPFGTILKNIMSYSYCSDRFTAGQAYRMRYYIANNFFGNLFNPELLVPITAENTLKPIECPITIGPAVSPYFYKIYHTKLNTISKYSDFVTTIPDEFYADYSCLNKTTLLANLNYELTLDGGLSFLNVYIDFNDDGQFNETNELVLKNIENGIHSIFISDNSVKNKFLRLRVVGSNINTHSACNLPSTSTENYGEIEDYAIKIIANNTCALMQSVKTGNWNDPSTWTCNRIPTALDDVTIMPYHVVSIPASYLAYARDISLKGSLNFELNSKLFCR